MPLNIEVTQFPNGIGSVGDNSVLNGVGSPLPMGGAVRVEDFDSASPWDTYWASVLTSGVTTRTNLLSSSGVLEFATDGTPGTNAQLEAQQGGLAPDVTLLQAGVPLWMAARLDISDPVVNGFHLGFVPGGQGLTPLDGIYLVSAPASGDVNIIVVNSAAAQETQLVGTLAAGPTGFIDVALYWDGIKASAQFPGGGGSFIPDVANISPLGLNPTFSCEEGAGGIATFNVDYLAFGGGR